MSAPKSLTQQENPFHNTTDLVCDKCQGKTFIPAFQFKQKSALLSASGKRELMPIQVFACIVCNHVNDSFTVKN